MHADAVRRFEQKEVYWRPDSEKMKREHKTPLFAPAMAALKAEQQRQLLQGQSLADVRTG